MTDQETTHQRASIIPSQRGRVAPQPIAAGSGTWWRNYSRRVAVTDALAVLAAVAVAYLVRFDISGLATVSGEFAPTYLAVSITLAGAWLAALALGRTRDRRVVGSGTAEYSQVFTATWRLFATVAVIAFLFRMEIGRGYLGFAAPVGLVLILLSRLGWRRWLHRRRRRGDMQSSVLVIGHRDKAARLIGELHHNPLAGYAVVGVCVPTGEVSAGEMVGGVPVLGSMNHAAAIAESIGASAVAVTGADTITSETVRQLGWDLEGKGIDLALTMTLLDVAGPRVIMQPVNGLPLMYVDEPRFTGGRYVAKSMFDWVAAVVITVTLSPLLLVLAALVGLTSAGPVFYTQERIGKDGRRFKMIKFRSMVTDAHSRLGEVLALEGVDDIRMFYKPKNDPRVTKVGRLIRRYSLDELPQLLNVLRGEMSLVGPRPQVDAEVAHYDRAAHRRLLVKPGLTGLWQISGRSDLSPEAGIRMDVSYVENWTLFGDALIIAKTAKAMVSAAGAY